MNKLIKKCSKCGEIKFLSEFYGDNYTKDGLNFWCKDCIHEHGRDYYKRNREKILNYNKNYYKINKEKRSIYMKDYQEKNKEKIRIYRKNRYEKNKKEISERQRIYRKKNREKRLAKRRKTTLGYGRGVISGLDKRDYTGHCELCGKANIFLSYHHWDDKDYNKGIWVCNPCHQMITAYEKGKFAYLKKYLGLKIFFDKQFKIKKQLELERS